MITNHGTSIPGTAKRPTLHALETTRTFSLDETAVWVAGDWHANAAWMRRAFASMQESDPFIRTLLHAGDWDGLDLDAADDAAAVAGIERILITLGNHETYAEWSPLIDCHPGEAVRISRTVWILPRPFTIHIAGRTILSLGGAASVDRYWRRPGHWFAQEQITDQHVSAAVAASADVMITHETPDTTPVAEVAAILSGNPLRFPAKALRESQESRTRVQQVWDATRPALLLHGHMHPPGRGTTADGREVISLGCANQKQNVVRLDLRSLGALPLKV